MPEYILYLAVHTNGGTIGGQYCINRGITLDQGQSP